MIWKTTMKTNTMTPIEYYKEQLYDLIHHHTNIGNVILSWIGDSGFDIEYMHPTCAANASFFEAAFYCYSCCCWSRYLYLGKLYGFGELEYSGFFFIESRTHLWNLKHSECNNLLSG